MMGNQLNMISYCVVCIKYKLKQIDSVLDQYIMHSPVVQHPPLAFLALPRLDDSDIDCSSSFFFLPPSNS